MNNLNTASLSKREKALWNKIRNKSGVLMAYGIPGISKSATFRTMAHKLGIQYIDLRLSTMDETDLGVYPHKEILADGTPVVKHSIPEWAMKSNEQPTIIHFEEMNRCGQNIRNAALGILLERCIGPFFKFNSNVYMVASGNPVTDVDNDVFMLGTALINRLIVHKFTLKMSDWIEEFAKPHGVNSTVLQFLGENPHYFGSDWNEIKKYVKNDGEVPEQYPSPRSWTFFSDYLNGFDSDDDRDAEMLDTELVTEFLGETTAMKWCQEVRKYFNIKLDHILNGTINSKIDEITVNRLLNDLIEKYTHLGNLNEMQYENFVAFFDAHLSTEQRAGFISKLVYDGHITNHVKELGNHNIMFVKKGDNKNILRKIMQQVKKPVEVAEKKAA